MKRDVQCTNLNLFIFKYSELADADKFSKCTNPEDSENFKCFIRCCLIINSQFTKSFKCFQIYSYCYALLHKLHQENWTDRESCSYFCTAVVNWEFTESLKHSMCNRCYYVVLSRVLINFLDATFLEEQNKVL